MEDKNCALCIVIFGKNMVTDAFPNPLLCCYVVSFFGKNPLRFPSTLALVSGKQSKGSGSGPTFPDSVTLIG